MKKSEWLDCQGKEFFPKQKGTPSLVKIEHKNTGSLDSARLKKNLVAVLQLYWVMVDAMLCAQHLLLKRMIQIDVGAICYLRVSTTRTWVRIVDIGDETVDCVSVQFFASKRKTLCIHY